MLHDSACSEIFFFSENIYPSGTSTEYIGSGLSPVRLVAMKILSQVTHRNTVEISGITTFLRVTLMLF
jgi:hypothetical protein